MIRFYGPHNENGDFSNFSDHPVTIYGRTWKTAEHAYQARKFWPKDGLDVQTFEECMQRVGKIAACPTPGKAAKLGRSPTMPISPEWERKPPIDRASQFLAWPGVDDTVPRSKEPEALFIREKDCVMAEVVLAKFSQHENLLAFLMSTGAEPLAERSERDYYWGWGADLSGHNKLGRILMSLRALFREFAREGLVVLPEREVEEVDE